MRLTLVISSLTSGAAERVMGLWDELLREVTARDAPARSPSPCRAQVERMMHGPTPPQNARGLGTADPGNAAKGYFRAVPRPHSDGDRALRSVRRRTASSDDGAGPRGDRARVVRLLLVRSVGHGAV